MITRIIADMRNEDETKAVEHRYSYNYYNGMTIFYAIILCINIGVTLYKKKS